MDLDDLIGQVEGDEPLDRLASAMTVKGDMDELTDNLIGHFVDQARRAGCSWSEIGSAMGVTKQAAQQRHTSERSRRDRDRDREERRGHRLPVFGRYTQRARIVVREAQAAAYDLGCPEMETEHLLLGILAVPRCLAAESLTSMGLNREQVSAKLEVSHEPRRRGRTPRMPFSADATKVLELTIAEAMKLGHNYVGTEHILLALYDAADGKAASILDGAGITRDRVQADMLQRIQAAS
jgi:hypothetical protein